MNQVCLVGRICRDLDLKKTSEQGSVINNTIAVNRSYKDRNGESITDFIPFVVWNQLAKTLNKYACKGQRIGLSGTMQSRKYTNSENVDVYVLECLVSEITLLDKPNLIVDNENNVRRDVKKYEDSTIEVEDMQVDQEMVANVLTQLSEKI